MKKAAKAIAYIYHPLLIPSLGMLVIFSSETYLSYLPFEYKKVILLSVFLTTFIVPLTFIPFFIYNRIISNIRMDSSRERSVPLVVSLILYVFCFFLFRYRFNLPLPYSFFLLGGTISIFFTLLITQRYKLSIHMVGAGGLTALIVFLAFTLRVDLRFYLEISLIMAGLTGTARLIVKAHTPDEVYTGFLLGFSTVLVTMLIT